MAIPHLIPNRDEILRALSIRLLGKAKDNHVMLTGDSIDEARFEEIFTQEHSNNLNVDCYRITREDAARFILERDSLVPRANSIVEKLVSEWIELRPELAGTKEFRAPFFTGFKFTWGGPWIGQILAADPKVPERPFRVAYVTIKAERESVGDPACIEQVARAGIVELEQSIFAGDAK